MTAHRVALDLHTAELQPLDLDVEENAKDACHQLLLIAERAYDQYKSTVGSYHQTRVEDHHAPGASTRPDSPLSDVGRVLAMITTVESLNNCASDSMYSRMYSVVLRCLSS